MGVAVVITRVMKRFKMNIKINNNIFLIMNIFRNVLVINLINMQKLERNIYILIFLQTKEKKEKKISTEEGVYAIYMLVLHFLDKQCQLQVPKENPITEL